MNIAIVIGVSEYNLPDNNLPGCKNDSEIIYNILDKTGKYEEILKINDNSNSAKLKEKLTDFIANYKDSEIEEIFFYYTGHGEFYNDEFYYLLTDYNPSKRNQTSLQNTEIDNLFKTLNPDLMIKVLDACQSGKNYIKNIDTIEKYFKDKEKSFNNCYFLNSSLNNQYSYIYGSISEFTFAFINSLKNHLTKDIRFKDIIDFISDEFDGNTQQTPFFVIQANYTEKFCTINDDLKTYLSTIKKEEISTEDSSKEISLFEKIKEEAKQYLTKEQCVQLLEQIKSEIEGFKLNQKLENIYDLNITFFNEYENIIKKEIVGNWLKENPNQYFAKVKYEKKYTDSNSYLPFNTSSRLFGISSELNPQSSFKEYKFEVSGFDLEIDLPFKSFSITLNSKFPNVDSYTCRAIFLLSKKDIRFFYFITNFEEKNWDERKLNRDFDWVTLNYQFVNNEELINGVKKLYESLENNVIKYLETKYE